MGLCVPDTGDHAPCGALGGAHSKFLSLVLRCLYSLGFLQYSLFNPYY